MADLDINMADDGAEPTQPKAAKSAPQQTNEPAPIPPASAPVAPIEPNSPVPQTPKKPRGKLLIIVSLVVILAVAGAAYFFLKKKPAYSNNSTTTSGTVQADTTETSLLVYKDPTLYAIDKDGKKSQLATVEPNSRPLRYVSDDKGGGTFFYATGKISANTWVATGVKKTDGKTDLSVYTPVATMTIDSAVISMDGKTLAVSESFTPTADKPGLASKLVNIQDGVTSPVDVGEGVYRAKGFTATGQLVLQSLACYFCDGPPLPKITLFDQKTQKVTKTYEAKATGDGSPDGEVIINFDGANALIAVESSASQGDTKESAESKDFKVNLINFATEKNEVIYTKPAKTDVKPFPVGFNLKSGAGYVTVDNAVGKEGFAEYKFNRLVDVKKGSKSDIALEFATLKAGGKLEQAYSLDGKTLFMTLSTTTTYDAAKNKMSLVSLPYQDEKATTSNVFEPSASYVQVLGTLTTKK